ncbi:MAG: ABC transporter ATP-binding protein [candidate division WS6 bacterium GW2011_GWF2_39_15]|uniref:ABC transporter ATP-binding protein n=1 Tax=candidate division WS6 bacterium GW2011_GWF2_39_15 TaxID=1619100 RepID=A0A0G0MQ10_9BACT|nr:MAG: ABC transporter ATP-binding protein [candidate division WS6 bacterium GW2011_GWF2_39_15]
MLKINLSEIEVGKKLLLRNIVLNISPGTITILTGSNGAGKSTIAKAIMGNPDIKTVGEIYIDDSNITAFNPYLRAQKGIYLSHQNPIGINGIKLGTFLRTTYMQMEYIKRKTDLLTFRKTTKSLCKELGLSTDILERDLNVGYSGGEMKKVEFLQLLLLSPKYAILDEIDSGLDAISRKRIFKYLSDLVQKGLGVLLITHRENIDKELKVVQTYKLENKTLTNV